MRVVRILLAGALLLLVVAASGLWWWGWRTPAYPMPALTGTLEQRSFDHDGLPRAMVYYVPARLPPSVPVLLVLHGSAGNPDRMRSATAFAFDALADRDGFVVVYPAGHEGNWNDCRRLANTSAKQLDVDDVGFLRAAVARLDGDPSLRGSRVDPARIFAVGLSNGGQMAYRLALEAPDFVAGVAAIAASLPAPDNFSCNPQDQPTAVLILNGTADPISPYAGGEVRLFGPFGRRGLVRSAEDTARYFSSRAGYTAPPFEHRYPDTNPDDGTVATRAVWSGAGRPEVDLTTIHGGGHTIPHPRKRMPRIFGPTSHDVPAAEEIWRFFLRQRPAAAQQPGT